MSFADLIRGWLAVDAPSAQCAQRAECPGGMWPAEAPGWDIAAREVFLERLAIADEMEMEAAPGSPAWNVALREACRAASGLPADMPESRGGDLVDTTLASFVAAGGLAFIGTLSREEHARLVVAPVILIPPAPSAETSTAPLEASAGARSCVSPRAASAGNEEN